MTDKLQKINIGMNICLPSTELSFHLSENENDGSLEGQDEKWQQCRHYTS